MLILLFEVERARVLQFPAKNSSPRTPPDTEPPLRLFKEKKLKQNFIGKKSLIFISKWLFDLNVKGFLGKFWAAM
jgi:hypothetical protein